MRVRYPFIVALLAITLGSFLSWAAPLQQPDPPLPDAVAFCHKPIDGGSEYENCMCAMHEHGGAECAGPRQDTGRPRFCKWMCGHAKNCGCCVS